MKDKKYIYITLTIIFLLAALGISYAWFNAVIKGNDTAKEQSVITGNLELTFTDDTEVTLPNAVPGDSYTKTISVKNTGTLDAKYNLVWQELTNEITNDELVIEATCKRLNSSNTEEGTCESISQTPIKSNTIKKNISIEPSVTHEYTIKVTFIDTGSLQDYNKKKSFSGKLGIEEYKLPTSVSFAEDSWKTIAELVKAGKTDSYNVGDTKTVDMGTYGTHTLRVANTSTPTECSTEGFSQSACGFVLEFTDIITTHKMNDNDTNVGGWPASSMRTFVNNNIYNALPADLKNIIIDTTVVSGHGREDTANFTSTDKLYLLSTAEACADTVSSSNIINEINSNTTFFSLPAPEVGGGGTKVSLDYDSARSVTRQLDYYKNLGTSTSNYSGAIKKNGTSASNWWLRAAHSFLTGIFYRASSSGYLDTTDANNTNGVSPAFRLG